MQRAGILFVIPAPAIGADPEKLFREAFTEELEKELSTFHLGEHFLAAQQTFRLDANWQLMYDTFGEGYHVPVLHSGIAPTLAGDMRSGGTAGFQAFGPKADRIDFGKFTTKMMASGEVEESRWAEPSVINHLTHLYHLGPNSTLFIQPGNLLRAQVWPGRHPGESTVTFYLYTFERPTPAALKEFKFLLDIVAVEDMPCLPKIQQNFAANRHAEVVFGRNEPCLTHEHRNIDAVLKGRY